MRRIFFEKLETLGQYFYFLGVLIRTTVKRPFRIAQLLMEIERLGIHSLFIIILSGSAMGMIFSLQMAIMLQSFHAEIGTGAAVAVAMSREIAPVITTLMLIAKNGSAMAAELGTMRVTEQIDSLEAMSVSAEHYLVVPKVIASLLVFPLLTLLSNMMGTLGAYIVATSIFSIDPAGFLDYLFDFLSPRDIFVGLIKSVVMAFIVSTICCFFGLRTSRGAKGVGDSATAAVVASSVSILVADYLLATLLLKVVYQ
jgi:phospholipid/cholesterol/gamma-HCH transport system permease protein